MTIVKFFPLHEAKSRAVNKTTGETPTVVFRQTKEFTNSFAKHKAEIGAKMAEFLKLKASDPMARFGAKDQHFAGGGPLADAGVIHAHLNHDVQIIYKRSGKNPTMIDLLLVGSHDDLGTGQPIDMKLQKRAAKQFMAADPKPAEKP